MKKKVLKILAAIGILLYIIGFIFVTKIIVDNTVSKSEAKDIAVKYIANKYKGKDYYIDVIDSYNPKEGYYSVHVKSKSSKDSYFYLEIQLDGKIRRDTYIDHVKERGNTASRISDDYDRLIEKTFNKKNIPFKRCGAYGEIKYMSKEDKEYFLKSYNEIETKDAYDEMWDESYYLVSDELELDKKYDIKKIGKESGRITIFIIDKKASVKKAAEYLLRIKDFLDKEDVPFYAIDLWLQYSEKDDEISASKNIYIENFFYKDIEEKGLEKRIKRRMEANS